ncbi:MAG TPA: hypothetical protein PKZ03_01505 [Methanothrix sp.]|uniref:hypothetical protein n=1 Tax=Methanothrix sp. TaxID=90426 RepID=UPI0025DBD185|nr:hypothetical protein [Methanothrix sp.]HPW72571.1 hypothetical protein [Methanothrix sp.]
MGGGPAGASPAGLGQVALLLIGDAQGRAGVIVLQHHLQAAVHQLSPLIKLAEIHITEAQVVEEIGILGSLAEEFLQVDAGLGKAACGEELVSAGEVVVVGQGEISPNAEGRILLS